jgi:hypothetical protein
MLAVALFSILAFSLGTIEIAQHMNVRQIDAPLLSFSALVEVGVLLGILSVSLEQFVEFRSILLQPHLSNEISWKLPRTTFGSLDSQLFLLLALVKLRLISFGSDLGWPSSRSFGFWRDFLDLFRPLAGFRLGLVLIPRSFRPSSTSLFRDERCIVGDTRGL